jgi:predicted ArsR family transcriptional regulator
MMIPPWAKMFASKMPRKKRDWVAGARDLGNICIVEIKSNRAPKTAQKTGMHRVAETLLLDGPASARALAKRLGVTPAAVRRHLDSLLEAGWVSHGFKPAYGPSEVGGRGRPARVYSLTANGRKQFAHGYDHIALEAMSLLDQMAGRDAVDTFSSSWAGGLRTRITSAAGYQRAKGLGAKARVVSEVLNSEGYAATLTPARGPVGGLQLCQHNCPVEVVAAKYPQICEHETQALGEALGVHVTRIATIAAGDGVCTTMIPDLGVSSKSATKMKTKEKTK